jgi:phosphate starvation-inducible PhoH-like protein
MRGRTFLNAFVILDEAQNATMSELRLFMSRIGMGSKMVMVGDTTQTDLMERDAGGFKAVINRLQNLDGVGYSKLTGRDIVRHPLISAIEERLAR